MINKLHENSIDELFRVKLNEGEQHVDYREADWDSMEKRLDRPSGNIYRFRLYAAAAAVLIAITGAWLFFSTSTNNTQPEISMATPGLVSPAKPHTVQPAAPQAGNSETGSDRNTSSMNDNVSSKMNATGPAAGNTESGSAEADNLRIVPVSGISGITSTEFTPVTLASLTETDASVSMSYLHRPMPVIISHKKALYRDRWSNLTLGIIASTDLNGAGSIQKGALGNNIGLMLTAHVIGNWSISTGAVYAKKPYTIPYSEYNASASYPYSGQPNQVHADCRMLDLPVNINYTLNTGRDNRFMVNAGISSYMMLQEKYYYEYGGYDNETKELSVNDHDQVWLSVVNLGVSYEKRIGSDLSIDFEPYLKLPINKIGYGRVRLRSVGFAIRLNWGIPEI